MARAIKVLLLLATLVLAAGSNYQVSF